MPSSPYTSHFLSADTIVPGYTNPQNLNRYSYVTNNPLRYADPTGHLMAVDDGGGQCDLNCVHVHNQNNNHGGGGGNSGHHNDDDDNVPHTQSLLDPIDADEGINEFHCFNHPYDCGNSPSIQAHSTDPDWRKYIAGGVALLAGEITMVIGGVVMLSAFAEIGVGVAATPETFGISDVIALVHAPAELAIGGLIFGAGAGLAYFGGKTMLDSGVPGMIYNNFTPIFK